MDHAFEHARSAKLDLDHLHTTIHGVLRFALALRHT